MTLFTVERFERMPRPLPLGRESGLVILPLAHTSTTMVESLYRFRDQSPGRGDTALRTDPIRKNDGLYATLLYTFARAKWAKRKQAPTEPAWIRGVPSPLVQEINRQRFLDQTEERFANFPLGGFDYAVSAHPNSLLHQTEKAFSSDRLWRIHQWGYLQPIFLWDEFRETGLRDRSPHVRQTHMRDAYVLMQLITRNTRLPRWIRIVLSIAALTHDVFTVAGGDSMKWCDSGVLNEERLYGELLSTTGWETLVKRFCLPRKKATQLLIDTVQGRGPYRHLLKLVDWIAYLGRDVSVYARMVRSAQDARVAQEDFSHFINRHPRLCRLWETIGVENGQVFLRDIDAYITFARARMHLYHEVYLNPELRYREFLIATVIGSALYEDGALTKEFLLRSTDFDLDEIFTKALELDDLSQLNDKIGQPTIETFGRREEGLQREAELLAEGVRLVLLEDLSAYRIKPGIDFLVQTPEGLKSFAETCSAEADWLQHSSKLKQPVRIYYVRDARVPPVLDSALRRYHARRTTHSP